MKISTLYCLAAFTSVWAAPGNFMPKGGNNGISQDSNEHALAHNNTVAQEGLAITKVHQDWLDELKRNNDFIEKHDKEEIAERAESPNNEMSYEEFRILVLRSYLSARLYYDAVSQRKDPEQLKNFRSNFLLALKERTLETDSGEPKYRDYLLAEEESSQASDEYWHASTAAEKAIRENGEDEESAKKAMEEAREAWNCYTKSIEEAKKLKAEALPEKAQYEKDRAQGGKKPKSGWLWF